MKTKQLIILTTILSITIFFISCSYKNESQELKQKISNPSKKITTTLTSCPDYIKKNKQNNLNINFLLDLSDRIKSENQKENDIATIKSIAQIFNQHIKSKKVQLLHDKISFFFEPTPKDEKISKLINSLNIYFTKNSSKEDLNHITHYDSLLSNLYDNTINNAKISGFYGSDTWRFFENKVKSLCVDDCYRNILIIITDGYMYHKNTKIDNQNRSTYLVTKSIAQKKLNNNNWKKIFEKNNMGFIPATQNLTDLEIFVIGLNSDNNQNPFEIDVLKAYWTQWFSEMGIKHFKIESLDISQNTQKKFVNFLSQKN